MAQAIKPRKAIEDPIEKAQNGVYGASIQRTWLIQRLNAPIGRAVNPFTFGAGSSGLSEDAITAVSPIFRFDYMGGAEYEGSFQVNGHPPIAVALHAIAEYCGTGKGVAGTVVLDREWKEAHYICSKEQKAYVEDLLRYLYKNTHNGSRTRDWVGLRETLRYDSQDQVKLRGTFRQSETFEEARKHLPLGWLELDNRFLFFADKEMFEKSCKLFEVK